jgi:integrase
MEQTSRKQDAAHGRRAFRPGHKPPKGLHPERDFRGNPIWIYREGHGPRIRIKEAFGTQAFEEAYYAARHQYGHQASPAEALIPQKPGHADPASLQWLIDRYLAWLEPKTGKGFAPMTKKAHRNTLTRIGKKLGSCPYTLVDKQHIRYLRDDADKKGAKTMANRAIFSMRGLYVWAIKEMDLLPEGANPTDGVATIATTSTSRHKWSDVECDRFEAAYGLGTLPRLAYDLYCFTGQRTSDVVKMGWSHLDLDEGVMTIVQQKTGKTVIVPVMPELLESITAAEQAGVLGKETFLGSERYGGRTFSADGFGNVMRKACDEVGIPECTAHGLRHKATMRCVANGADMGFLCTVFGYTPVTAQRYIDGFDGAENVKRGAHFLRRKPVKLRVVKAA